MFNWSTAPTFAVMLLFWLLAAYVITRTPRSLVSLAGVGAQVATAAYLLGQGMQANAATLAEWRPWARNLLWGATLAPSLWYWLTVLLLRDQPKPVLQRFLRWVGYPAGVIFAAAGVLLTACIYIDDWLFRWSAPVQVPASQVIYSRFHLKEGPLDPLFLVLLVGTTLGAALNLVLGWRYTTDPSRRRGFAWLALSALLFIVAANTLGIASSLAIVGDWSIGLTHLVLGAAMLTMAWNVAAYSLLLRGQVIRGDALHFFTSLIAICAGYALVLLMLSARAFTFRVLSLLMIVLVLVILSHALLDASRRLLDRLFFGSDVQRLRSNLTSAVQDAALTPDLGLVLDQARQEISAVSADHWVHLTEEALRRLNNPAALARCELVERIPRTLGSAVAAVPAGDPTPLQRAQILRETLVQTIERLKPAGDGSPVASPGALQYQILREEYLQGMPNKQIMTRYSISESTFHRNRREAIAILARELSNQEHLTAPRDFAIGEGQRDHDAGYP